MADSDEPSADKIEHGLRVIVIVREEKRDI